MNFSIVVAVDKNFGIGKDGRLPWHLPSELRHFKDVTIASPGIENAVIMGRKTWESLPEKFRPLPGRCNIVISGRNDLGFPPGVIQAATFQEALAAAEMMQADSRIGEVFVIGGAQVFGEAIQSRFCRKIFMTHILKDFHCDVFFPAPMENYRQIHASVPVVENGVSYFFAEYLRG